MSSQRTLVVKSACDGAEAIVVLISVRERQWNVRTGPHDGPLTQNFTLFLNERQLENILSSWISMFL